MCPASTLGTITNMKKRKAKRGAWYVKVRGSYLPANWQGVLMQLVLLGLGIGLLLQAYDDTRPLAIVIITFVLEIIGLGALFTWIAKNKS